MKKYICTLLITVSLAAFGCGGQNEAVNSNSEDTGSVESIESSQTETAGNYDSPTAAVRSFIEGVRAKDEARMKAALSKKTVEEFESIAKRDKASFFEVTVGKDYETASQMPEMRNEKIDGDSATLEVKDQKTGQWGPIPFVKEDGGWKIALFDGSQSGQS